MFPHFQLLNRLYTNTTLNREKQYLQVSDIKSHNILTLIGAGFLEVSMGGGAQRPPEKIGHISQTVKASLTKFSDISNLAIQLLLSLFGARLHA